MRISLAAFMPVWLVTLVCGCGSTTSKLVADLRSDDPIIRRAAARMAGETPQNISEPVIAALAGATKDPDREVRELAVAALGRAGPVAKSSEATLEDALEDKEESVQVSAALALEKIDPESIRYKRVILKALAAGNGPVFLAVGRMRPQAKWSVPTLSKLLSHPEVGIRALAARTLGQIGVAAADAEPALNRALHDDNPAVRRAAEQALGKIRPERAAVH